MNEQTDNGNNGRDNQGRFIVGNKGGPGNPHAKQVALLRGALLSAVTPEDLHDVIRVLIEKALSGNVSAIKELLDRLYGKPTVAVEMKQELQSTGEIRARLRALISQNPSLLDTLVIECNREDETNE
jgi:hypothetical protein